MNIASTEDIQQLLLRFTEGDEQAFRTLYQCLYNKLLLYGCTITSCRETIEDQLQEVFSWLYTHPQQCQSIRNIESYLYLSLRKNIRSALQKETTQQTKQYDYYSDEQQQAIPSVEEGWIQHQTHQQQQRWMTEQVDRLPARMKEVVYLRYHQCLSYREIAQIMSVTPQVAQNFATRALKKLRQSLPQLQRALSFILAFLLSQ